MKNQVIKLHICMLKFFINKKTFILLINNFQFFYQSKDISHLAGSVKDNLVNAIKMMKEKFFV